MEHPFLVEEFTPEHATHIGFASAHRFVTAEPQPSARHIHKTLKANRPVQRRLSDSAFTSVGEMIDKCERRHQFAIRCKVALNCW